MDVYEKRGYLDAQFKVFYLNDTILREFEYHYHDFDKIIIFLKGNVNYTIEGKSYELRPFDIVMVEHGEIHRLEITHKSVYERIIIYISPDYIQSYRNNEFRLGYCFDKAKQNATNVLRISSLEKSKLYQNAVELKNSLKNNEFAEKLYQELLFLQFMIHLNRAVIGESIEYLNTNLYNQKVVDMIEYININLTEGMNIESLAQHFYMSKYHMMRLFKQETGYTIGNYINHKRLLMAREMIAKGHPITQTCYECGFKDHSTFSRAYKNLFGESPRVTQGGKK